MEKVTSATQFLVTPEGVSHAAFRGPESPHAMEARREVISPYYIKEEAAAYLRTTVDGIYARVERGQLERCPGVRDYLFTKEMLDASVMRQGKVTKKRRAIAGRNS